MKLDLQPGPGRHLSDLLFATGVEFPCGGEANCGGCRVRVLSGQVPATAPMRQVLSEEEIAAGWRLACVAEADGPVSVEVDQWTVRILSDEQSVALEPRPGRGAVIDLGTTTLVVQTVDLATGEVLGVETDLNPQARFGADVMSRIQYQLHHPGSLTGLIRERLGAMLQGSGPLEEILIVGNTAMHHLFCGLDVEPLSHVPFESPTLGAVQVELDWPGPAIFLPNLGGFVGSDLLAGIVATGLDTSSHRTALFDIGTNGEIVVGSSQGIRCASTAAGPAFEGGRISKGMRAGAGAIDSVHAGLECRVIGGVPARGICGSGLVDAVAVARQQGLILPGGRVTTADRRIPLTPEVALTQGDIRELQLAKGAMAAGLKMLNPHPPEKLYLAGAFGNYIRQSSACAIGLLPEGCLVEPVGNSALRGARILLLTPSTRRERLERLLSITTHVELASDPDFQDLFAESMTLMSYTLE
ncbi:ASKHA domain-containing protein [uncultured Paludibaculum sp.]|uniref:ASKHA domain-containing protein n=1 Tax=uncultured Paludibaculum sp. TaxID=1765020 RepID=UPI002AAB7D31|nr:ASKHA domain-containing protein [uncultured Paludibaculum sp.]